MFLLLPGCVSMTSRQQQAWQQASQVMEACRAQRLTGELPDYTASVQCSNSRMRQIIAAGGYPYMDLVDLWLAYRMALAQHVDDGTLTEADMNLKGAELKVRLTSEARRRDAMAQEARAQEAMNTAALLQGLAVWNAPMQPPTSSVPPRGTITCWTYTGGWQCH
jgi:hypothetical protein